MRGTLLAALIALLTVAPAAFAKNVQTAIFAGGCFWCVESDMDKIDGVLSTTSGYTGGNVRNPSYKQISKGGTGHFEAVQVTFDADKVTYVDLARRFMRSIDPLDAGGQFCDRGQQYSTAIFAVTPQQATWAQQVVSEAQAELGQKVATTIRMASPFYKAEDYHQDYYQKSDIVLTRFGPISKASAYKKYRKSCGRDARVRQVWGAAAFPGS